MPIEQEKDGMDRSKLSRQKLCVLLNIALILSCTPLFSISAAAQRVIVQFVNGRSGKPIKKGTRVWVHFSNQSGRQILDLHTNDHGVVQFAVDGATTFQVSAVGLIPCGEQPVGTPVRDYPIEEIIEHGLLTKNDCGNLNSEPLRGRLIYFVRPASWWELFKN